MQNSLLALENQTRPVYFYNLFSLSLQTTLFSLWATQFKTQQFWRTEFRFKRNFATKSVPVPAACQFRRHETANARERVAAPRDCALTQSHRGTGHMLFPKPRKFEVPSAEPPAPADPKKLGGPRLPPPVLQLQSSPIPSPPRPATPQFQFPSAGEFSCERSIA